MALEAQLAPITAADIAARTERMRAEGVVSCWFTDRARPPWLGAVPSVRLAHDDGRRLVVVEGLVRFAGRWAPAPAVSLPRFLGWVFTGTVLPHRPRTPYPLDVVWTAPQYVRAEDTYLAEQERWQRLREARAVAARQALEKKQAEIRKKNAISWAKAMDKAAAAERAAHGDQQAAKRREQAARRPELARARALLAHEHGITATVGWSSGDPCYAGGIPLVGEDGVLAAVFDPVPRRIRGDAFLLLAGLLLLFPTRRDQVVFEDVMKRTWHKPSDGYRMDFVDGRWCACTVPQLVAGIGRFEYPAEPSDQMGPAATLYRAECRACGGRYAQPWRRTSSTPTD